MKQLVLALMVGAALVGCGDMGMGNQRKDQVGETVVGQVKARAEDSVCMNNLGQIRGSIAVAKTDPDATNPATLQELRLPADMLKCPIDDRPYDYDPTTGTVRCKHLGHEKY